MSKHNGAEVLKQFQVDVKNLNRQKVRAAKRIMLDTFAFIQDKSPIKYGRYRASHRLTIGGDPSSFAASPPRSGELKGWVYGIPIKRYAALAAAGRTIAAKRLDAIPPDKPIRLTKVIISNNVPYAQELEAGSSGQAPRGIYSIAAIFAENRFRRINLNIGFN